jgi:hypothetical protein
MKKLMVGMSSESLEGMLLFAWLNRLQWTKVMKRGEEPKRK